MALGIRGSNPIWAEFDLTGKIFDDTYWLFVLENTLPYIPATVYHDPDLNTPWTNPIQFLANGTLPNDIYFESDHVYRLEFRQGDTQADPLIYEVNNYVAGAGGSTPVDTVAFASSNQITNPQFALINFTSPYTLSATDPVPMEVAPGWFLELAGTGTVVVTQVPLNNTNINPSNAPYALRLTMTGWTSGEVFLRQRFQQNGMLWANKTVSSTVTALLDGAPQNISAILIDSNDAVLTTVLTSTPVNESWNEFTGYGELPATTNPDVPPAAYIDYRLLLPNNVDIYLTSFQLVVQDLPIEPSFEQDSIDRQIDHTFHYFKPQLAYKPIPNYAIGWDFGFNPCQALGVSVTPIATGANGSAYIADQTIVFQVANSAIGATFNNYGVVLTTASDTSFSLIQYLDAKTAVELLNQKLSAQMKAFISTGTGTISGTVNLYWTTNGSLPTITTPSFDSLVTGITAGVPAVVSGWTAVPRGSLGQARFTINTTDQTIDFSGWDARAVSLINTATFFAMVITFADVVTSQAITIEYASLCGGDIATRPAPLTQGQTLFALQQYYEKSYGNGQLPGAVSSPANCLSAQQIGIPGGSGAALYATLFGINYQTIKRAAPTVTLYSTTSGAAANVSAYVQSTAALSGYVDAAASNWSATTSGDRGTNYSFLSNSVLATCAGTSIIRAWIFFHYVADARFGVV